VSDSTSPSEDPNETTPPPSPTEDGNQDPIDVNELLESTRKLFEPEDIQRAMEQAGYSPDPNTPVAAAALGDGENTDASDSGEASPVAVDAADSNDTTAIDDVAGSELVVDDTPASDEEPSSPPEEENRRGLNVLSVVAIMLVIALSPLAVVFGYIALGQARRASQRGETLALWAIGLGWVVLAGWCVVVGSLVWIGWEQGITLGSLPELIELFSLP